LGTTPAASRYSLIASIKTRFEQKFLVGQSRFRYDFETRLRYHFDQVIS
jgi:hypothetical protein